MAVLVDDLLKNVLINANSSDRIVIITGYFSPDIIDKIAALGKPFEYYYGMYGVDKIRPSVLSALRNINAKYSNLKISFVNTQRVHTKCYLFYDSNNMFNAMVGSANCSMQGLCSMANAEMLAELNLSVLQKGDYLVKLNDYYKKIKKNSIDINDLITNGSIDLIVNSPSGKESAHDDSYLRKAAIKAKIPYMTTIAGARATAKGILYVQAHGDSDVKSLQELHSEIKDAE